MEIDGSDLGTITLNAQKKDRVFIITGGNVTITDLTIANGRTSMNALSRSCSGPRPQASRRKGPRS
jgi:hypothetical protein